MDKIKRYGNTYLIKNDSEYKMGMENENGEIYFIDLEKFLNNKKECKIEKIITREDNYYIKTNEEGKVQIGLENENNEISFIDLEDLLQCIINIGNKVKEIKSKRHEEQEEIAIDKIDKLKADGYIVSSSINAIAYVTYITGTEVSIVENEIGYRLFCIEDNETNRKYFNDYKENYEDLSVNLMKYNQIIKKLKNLTKNYRMEGQ